MWIFSCRFYAPDFVSTLSGIKFTTVKAICNPQSQSEQIGLLLSNDLVVSRLLTHHSLIPAELNLGLHSNAATRSIALMAQVQPDWSREQVLARSAHIHAHTLEPESAVAWIHAELNFGSHSDAAKRSIALIARVHPDWSMEQVLGFCASLRNLKKEK